MFFHLYKLKIKQNVDLYIQKKKLEIVDIERYLKLLKNQ